MCAQSHMGVHFCKIFPCEFLHICISLCTKHVIQDVMRSHSFEGPCEAMVLQCASVTVGCSAPLRVLATRSVSEPARADKDTFFSLMIAAEWGGGRQTRDSSHATAGGGSKKWVIRKFPYGRPHLVPYPTGHCLHCQRPSRLTQSPEQVTHKVENLGYILYAATCQFIWDNLCHSRDCILQQVMYNVNVCACGRTAFLLLLHGG